MSTEIDLYNCTKCDLYKNRTNIVYGTGKGTSGIMLIGEAPGWHEDIEGIPFVGKSGRMLDYLLLSNDIDRDDVYITNVVKCRPPDNRDPTPKELLICSDYLDKEIDSVKPKIIIPLGRFASKYIVEKFGLKFTTISKMHGKLLRVNDITIVPMYHPAYAVYNPNNKSILLKDFEAIKNGI